MAYTATLGDGLRGILIGEDIAPGDQPSYQLAKEIYLYHPLGAKLTDTPVEMAQSQKRELSIPKGPENQLIKAFEKEWKILNADRMIFNVARLARVYGIASIAMLTDEEDMSKPIALDKLYDKKISFNTLDPLNTAGSLVLNQDPQAIDFQKIISISVGGKPIHPSRTLTVMNEDPIYIAYTSSAFGFVGRSVYQRALYPLKSYVQTMITDNLVSLKAGVLVAMLESPSSAIDGIMDSLFGQKRQIIKEAEVGNVISIGVDEKIESLNLQNIDNSHRQARKDIIDNIATAADMPAVIINQETFAEGFGEGTEDAKRVAQFVDRIRIWLQPIYDYFDEIVMYRAWNPEFYKAIQKQYPEEYRSVAYKTAFYEWKDSFNAAWPNLLREPDSERIKVDDVRLKAMIAMLEVLLPELDPENKSKLIEWAADNFNALELLFTEPLDLDYNALAAYDPIAESAEAEAELKPVKPPPPFSSRDSLKALDDAIARLPVRSKRAVVR